MRKSIETGEDEARLFLYFFHKKYIGAYNSLSRRQASLGRVSVLNEWSVQLAESKQYPYAFAARAWVAANIESNLSENARESDARVSARARARKAHHRIVKYHSSTGPPACISLYECSAGVRDDRDK